jgi:hypothetical protein
MAFHLELPYKIASIDFDDTLAENEYPDIGSPNLPLIDKIKEFQNLGNKWILWTCRTGQDLQKAVEWCESMGIAPDAVNEDIDDVKNSEFGRNKSVKVHCNFLVDDKAPSSIRDFLAVDFSMPQEPMDDVRFDLIGVLIK